MAENIPLQVKPSSWDLFWSFCIVGCFTFGGGLAMLPLIRREVVEKRAWMNDRQIIDTFAVAQSLPGAVAVNSALFIGKQLGGIWGALMALFGVVLPAFLSILLLLLFLTQLQDNIYVEKVFSGIKAASAGLIFLAAVQMSRLAAKGFSGFLIALAAFLMIIFLNINAAWTLVLGAMAGVFLEVAGRRKH